MKKLLKTSTAGWPALRAAMPLIAVISLLIAASSCSALKVQKDAFVRFESDLPLELGDEESTLGATNEWLPVYQLGGRSVNLIVKADNIPLDTVVLLRKKHPYNRVRNVLVVGVPLAAAVVVPNYYPEVNPAEAFQTAFFLALGALWADKTTDNYRYKLQNNQTISYELPNNKKERYAQVMKKAEENALADAVRKPASELTTVDYLPESLRAKFGLTSVPLAAPAASAVPASGASTPASAAPTTATTPATPSTTGSSASAPAGSVAAPVPAGQSTVVLKNTASTPIRVYLSVEKSFVVRAASSLPVQVPAGATLYLAQNARPLQLKAVGTAPAPNQPQLTLDLQQIQATWE